MESAEPRARRFEERGFGRSIGWGTHPALLVVDLQIAFTDPASPLGADLDREIAETVQVLDAARRAGAPVFFSAIAYDEPGARDAGLWPRKNAELAHLRAGGATTTLDPRLGRRVDEGVITKKYASVFFGTDLATRLTGLAVDTLILTGCTTSGCVRATAVDALQHGFRPMVVREAVGDRDEQAHDQSIFDLQAKYADVVSKSETVAYLDGARPSPDGAPDAGESGQQQGRTPSG